VISSVGLTAVSCTRLSINSTQLDACLCVCACVCVLDGHSAQLLSILARGSSKGHSLLVRGVVPPKVEMLEPPLILAKRLSDCLIVLRLECDHGRQLL